MEWELFSTILAADQMKLNLNALLSDIRVHSIGATDILFVVRKSLNS